MFIPAGRIGGNGSEHPFAVYLLCGLVFWQFFAACLSRSTVSLLENHDLVKKANFPREVVPLASLGNCAVNCAIGFGVFVVVRFWFEGGFGWGLLWLPVIFAIQCALSVGLALLCSFLNVHYRDVGYIVDVALTFGFYATPIFYSFDVVQQKAAAYPALFKLYMLNPMVGIITAYRQALLDNHAPSMEYLLYPLAFAVLALAAGVYVFRRNAALLADHL
ncbi:MAG: ABC transporter permease [Candidatus Hydrogenedentes bacterium]|nr:ABC transporter permease [Candidatus Hydrogenedentota bacterium]